MVVRGSGFHARHSPAGGGAGPPAVNTIILMHFDGTNGSTTYTDAAGTVTSFSTTGTASISTAQSVFGGSSLSLAASSWIAGTPSNTGLNIGTGDFTIELRGYITAIPTPNPINFCSFQPVSGRPAFNLGMNASGNIFAYISDLSNGNGYDGSSAISLNAFHALAVVRTSSTIYLFLDGAAAGSFSNPGRSLNLNGILFSVGSNTTAGANAAASMYVDELRVSKIARYTSAYTPASSPFTVD
jgi:Concanavalin A-like lectin/glucanases superfamily